MKYRGVTFIVGTIILIILVIASIGYFSLQKNFTISNPSTFCSQDSDCVYISGCDFCENTAYFNSHPKIPCPVKFNPTGNTCSCQNNKCIPVMTITTTTSSPSLPVQVLSIQSIPANPKVGDILNFNVTFKNIGNVPISIVRGAGSSSLRVTYSPKGFFNESELFICPQYVQLINVQPNEIASVGLDCPQGNAKLINSGTLIANFTLSWGYGQDNLSSSMSFSYIMNVS